ncbi:MAG: hypothetical protein ACD_79C01527G0010 [uncultured bacterium]|nr:MAG: hypothetical protein ACD_79C01527G0010 [uncultured bacterium]
MNDKLNYPVFYFKYFIPAKMRSVLKKSVIYFLKFFKMEINLIYNDTFATQNFRNKTWTEDFCDFVLKTFKPESVIDFGCGTGDILAPFEKRNLNVLGIDGSFSNKKYSHIRKENFQIFDIREKYPNKNKYDLCICMEVAEHIDEKYSETLIHNITNSAPILIFTAAGPGQEGNDHCNLQPKSWWMEKLRKYDFEYDDNLTNDFILHMSNMNDVQSWYIENLMIYRKF